MSISRMSAALLYFAFVPALYAQAPIPVVSIIPNGDFSLGNTGFTSSYLYQNPGATSPNTVFEQCTYTIAPNLMSPIPLHPSPGLPNFYDHTTGDITGNFMVINGSTTANKTFYSTSLAVEPNSTYQFSVWFTVWNDSSNNLPKLQIDFNGITSMIAVPTLPLGTWSNFTTTWFSGANTSVTIKLQDNVLDYGGNDFGMDDISFGLINAAVPEPGTLALMGSALAGTGGYWFIKRRRRKAAAARK